MRTRVMMVLFGWLALTLPGAAQEEAAEPPPPTETAEEVAEAATDDEVPGLLGDSAEDADDGELIFSEEIPADTQLVFPVDI